MSIQRQGNRLLKIAEVVKKTWKIITAWFFSKGNTISITANETVAGLGIAQIRAKKELGLAFKVVCRMKMVILLLHPVGGSIHSQKNYRNMNSTSGGSITISKSEGNYLPEALVAFHFDWKEFRGDCICTKVVWFGQKFKPSQLVMLAVGLVWWASVTLEEINGSSMLPSGGSSKPFIPIWKTSGLLRKVAAEVHCFIPNGYGIRLGSSRRTSKYFLEYSGASRKRG